MRSRKSVFYKIVDYVDEPEDGLLMVYPVRRRGGWGDHSFRGVYR